MMTDESPTNTTAGAATQTEQPIMVLIEHRPEIVLLQPESREKLFEHIEQEIAAFVPDLSTDKGRKEIAAMAFKVTRTKTAIEAARLRLTEEAREKIKAVNAEGAPIKERLDALAKQVRQPLTEWEEAEEKREAECKASLDRLRAAAIVPMGVTSDGIRARIAEVEAESMAEDKWAGMLDLATTAHDAALAALNSALALVEQKERDDADLARLREEAEARERADAERREKEDWERSEQERIAREEREAKELAERRQQQADEAKLREEEEAEQRRLAAEQAATAAAETARAEEVARAEQQAAEQKRAHEAELATERERVAAAERREQARIAAEEAAAAERARLEADQNRRTAAKREAKEAIMTVDGITEAQAKAIVLLIISGEVPRTFLDFAAEPKVRPASPEMEGRLV